MWGPTATPGLHAREIIPEGVAKDGARSRVVLARGSQCGLPWRANHGRYSGLLVGLEASAE